MIQAWLVLPALSTAFTAFVGLLLPVAASVGSVISGLAAATPIQVIEDRSPSRQRTRPHQCGPATGIRNATRRRPVRLRHVRPRAELHPLQRQGSTALGFPSQ